MALVSIERGLAASVVVIINAGDVQRKKRFFKPSHQQAFAHAVGYATYWAAELGVPFHDLTGKLSVSECADLLAAYRAEKCGIPAG
ncbi:MAG: hypothetical protein KDE15_02050 [Erythrobacter sp.]|nr:hypothetical protein [Erythrobacter sp.]